MTSMTCCCSSTEAGSATRVVLAQVREAVRKIRSQLQVRTMLLVTRSSSSLVTSMTGCCR